MPLEYGDPGRFAWYGKEKENMPDVALAYYDGMNQRVLVAREKVSETYADALKSPEAAEVHMAAQKELINRQDDLIAALREQLRQALDNAAPPVITTTAGEQ